MTRRRRRAIGSKPIALSPTGYFCTFRNTPVKEVKVKRKCLTQNVNKPGLPPECEYLVRSSNITEDVARNKEVQKQKQKRRSSGGLTKIEEYPSGLEDLPEKKRARFRKRVGKRLEY